MIRVQTYAPNQLVLAAELNAIQDNAAAASDLTTTTTNLSTLTAAAVTRSQLESLWAQKPSLISVTGTDIAIGGCGPLVAASHVLPGYTGNPGGFTGIVAMSPSLSASSWNFIYAFDSSGALAFESSSDLPDNALRHKSTDSSRYYVGCYRVDSAGKIVPFFKFGNIYTYSLSQYTFGVGDLAYNLNVASSAWQQVNLNNLVPPTARVFDAKFDLSNVSSSMAYLGLRTQSTGSTEIFSIGGATGGVAVYGTYTTRFIAQDNFYALSTNKLIEYSFGGTPAGCTMRLRGFIEGV